MENVFYGLEFFYLSGFFCSLIYIYFYNKYITDINDKIELIWALKFSLLSYIFVLMLLLSNIETYIRKKKKFKNIKEDFISFYTYCDRKFMGLK